MTVPFFLLRGVASSGKTVMAAAAILAIAGCGKAPEDAPATESQPESAQTPPPSKPSAVVQPPALPGATRTVYVATAFQAVNSDGTHDVPAGAAVKVVSEEGDEYVIEYEGISVRTPKSFFSETPVEEVPPPTPVAAAPTPDAIPLTDPAPALPEATPPVAEATPEVPDPAATPDPALAADAAKAGELIDEIRTLNDEIRSATDKLESAPADEKVKESAKIERLKKRRDALSGDLTKVAKP